MKGDWQHAGTADTYRELEPGDAFELPPRHVLPLISPTARCRRYRDSVDPSLSSNWRAGSTCTSSKGCTRRTQDMVILQMGRATSVTFHGSRRCAQYARRRARLASRRAAPGGQPSGGDEQTAALWSRGGSPSRSQEAARPASQIHVVRRNHDIANPGHRGHRHARTTRRFASARRRHASGSSIWCSSRLSASTASHLATFAPNSPLSASWPTPGCHERCCAPRTFTTCS